MQYTYTITDSDEIWGDSNTCNLLTITYTATGETRTCTDFTYLEEDVTQDELAFIFANM